MGVWSLKMDGELLSGCLGVPVEQSAAFAAGTTRMWDLRWGKSTIKANRL
uniref:Uncharacterized protein n=1 Tax=Candidozyma auris TaxID=498019 RepID=A0A0L0P381_CANAR